MRLAGVSLLLGSQNGSAVSMSLHKLSRTALVIAKGEEERGGKQIKSDKDL